MISISLPELVVFAGMAIVVFAVVIVRLLFNRKNNIEVRTIPRHLTATYRPQRILPLLLVLVSIVGWVVWESWTFYKGYSVDFKAFYIVSGLLLISQLILSVLDKPRNAGTSIDKLHTVILVPVYNEAADALKSCLESMLRQTHKPDEIHVVDDGTTLEDYRKLKLWFNKEAKKSGVTVTWREQVNAGKRHAHATGLDGVDRGENTIIITIDSDGTLDPKAIEEGLKPFSDINVQSVAGLVLARNAQENVLSRFTDLLFVGIQQLIDRASMSRLDSVLVNSGGLAFYRSSIVDDALQHGYMSETFFGRDVTFSDDSYLTLFALLQGKTVQQTSSIVFADMPVTFDHHIRQQMRWLRGSFIRSLWRLRYLPLVSWAFARQVVGWLVLVMSTMILMQLLFVLPVINGDSPPFFLLLVPVVVGYIQAVRYFAIERSDMSTKSQIAIYLLAPVAAFWSMVVLRSMRWYAMVTCLKTGWGTRSVIEIQTAPAISKE